MRALGPPGHLPHSRRRLEKQVRSLPDHRGQAAGPQANLLCRYRVISPSACHCSFLRSDAQQVPWRVACCSLPGQKRLDLAQPDQAPVSCLA